MSASKKGRPAPKGRTPSPPPSRWQTPVICAALVVITLAVFGQTLGHEFIDFDDNDYVYNNAVVSQGLTGRGFLWAFGVHAFNWHPLTWLSHMLDCQLYGLHPAGHHLTSVLAQAAVAVALFLMLRQMTGAPWRSAFIAAVFAIHPLRVESVAWVAERKDVLSGLFFVLTMAAYVRYARRPSPWNYGICLTLFGLGLMCKPMLVTAPLVLLLLDYWPLGRWENPAKVILEKLPLFGLAAASSLVTFFGQTQIIDSMKSITLPMRLGNAVVACVIYLGQMFYPAKLAPFYPYPFGGRPGWEVSGAAILLAGLTAVAFWQWRRRPWLLVGWLWYLVMILPVLGIIQVGRQAHADRYTYLPQIGIALSLTWLAAEWWKNRAALGFLMAGAIGLLAVCAWKQTTYWKNSEVLWTRTLACTSDNELAERALANAYFEQHRYAEAVPHYEATLRLRPDFPDAHYNYGTTLYDLGRTDEAIAQFQEAIRLAPAQEEAYNNLGIALLQKGDLDGADAQFQTAMRLAPSAAAPLLNRGLVQLRRGLVDQAMVDFHEALRLRPKYPDAHYNLGNAFEQKGQFAQAVNEYQQALDLDPNDPETTSNLAWLLAAAPDPSVRNGPKALELALRANQLTGGKSALVLHALAAALSETGRFAEAAGTARQALALAQAAGQQELVAQLGDELKRYEQGVPLAGPGAPAAPAK